MASSEEDKAKAGLMTESAEEGKVSATTLSAEEAEKAEAAAQAKNAREEKKLKEDAERKIRGMTESELERQVAFLLNQSSVFMDFQVKMLEENKVTAAVEEKEEEEEAAETGKENEEPKKKRGRRRKPETLAAKDSIAGALKAEKARQERRPGPQAHNHLPVFFKNGTLRPYQVEGYQWMKTLYLSGMNGILGDEMGLGKTVQAIAMVAHLYETGFSTKGPVLIVAPLSTLPNWVSEFKRFAPDIPVILYHGSKDARPGLRPQIAPIHRINGELCYPVIITSYQMIVMDVRVFVPFKFIYFIMDEGHRIKNHKCQLLQALKRLNISEGRLLLTGTPLQNDLTELWSLLNFILPVIFSDLDWFTAYFDFSGGQASVVEAEKKKAMVTKLHQILKPILLRRMKVDVELHLPPKREIIVYAPLAQEQDEIYRKVLANAMKAGQPPDTADLSQKVILEGKRKRRKTDYAAQLEEDDDKYIDSIADTALSFADMSEEFGDWKSLAPKKRVWEDGGVWICPEVNCQSRNALMLLRQIALHPFTVKLPTDTEGPYIPEDESIVLSSGKMRVADQLLSALKKTGHKVLFFSQFTRILDIIEVYASLRSFQAVRLDGNTSLEERAERIARFNSDPETFLFLLSTHAGNLGMNLVAADTVLIFDSDWNPQSDLQAQDRCHRIGQVRPVVVYRLTTRGTVDEKIVETAIAKRRVERTVIGGGKFHRLGRAGPEDGVSPEELARLLDTTDHSAIVDEKEKPLLSEDSLQSLLDRSFGQDGKSKIDRNQDFMILPQSRGEDSNSSTLTQGSN